jgi:hypothetical protein
MPTASLNNFGVVGVGDNDGALLMPKLQYRFRVTLNKFGSENADSTSLTQQVIDVSKPNLSFDDITLDTYNSRIYLAGKSTWEPITLNIRDDVTNAVQNVVGEQIQKQFDFFEQSSAAAGSDYKFDMKIEILDGGNSSSGGYHDVAVIESFALVGCYIQSANYNSLNYAESAANTISLTIRYDNALQSAHDNTPGIGKKLTPITSGSTSTA